MPDESQMRTKKVVMLRTKNMGDAIASKDLIRIRSGSPGLRSGATKV